MKNKIKLFGIAAFIAIIGFLMVTCDTPEDKDNKGENPFIGTWEDDNDFTLTCTDTTWTSSSWLFNKGAYSRNGNSATFTYTDGSILGTAVVSGNTMTLTKTNETITLTKEGTGSKTPKAADFTISGTGTVYFDGDYKTITVLPKTGKTSGARTIYYEGTGSTEYPKTTDEPLFFGTYNVTFDVAESTGWNAASGLSAGTLTIADGTPAAPTNVSVAVASATSARISWSTVTRAASYKVFYITEGMEELALAGTASTTSYTHNGLTANKIYYYYITAVSTTYGESNYSTFKAVLIAKPDAPATVEATATSSSAINIRWSSVTGAASYKVFYNTTGSSGEKQSWANNTYTGTSCSITGCNPNTTYYFFVKAVNAIGESDYSTAGSAKTNAGGASGAPTGLTAKYFADSEPWIEITWNKISNARTYCLYYTTGSPDNTKSSIMVDYPYGEVLSKVTGFTVQPNTTYYFWISAVSGFWTESGLSEMVVVSTGAPPPPPPPLPPTPPASGLDTPPSGGSSGQMMCLSKNCLRGNCNYSSILWGSCDRGYNTKDGKKCGVCNGTGKCQRCNGTGKI